MPSFGFEATEVYKSTLDINRAINEGRRLEEIQRRKEEAEKARKEAEERAKAEQEAQATAPTTCQPAEPVPVWEEEQEEQPAASWVNFSALLTTDQALMLKEFFESNGIQFKAI